MIQPRHLLKCAVMLILVSSCGKSGHRIRVVNHSVNAIEWLKIEPLNFERIGPGASTDFRAINEGSHQINGGTSTGTLSGSATISGKGEHEWTLSLEESGDLLLIREK